MTLWNIPNQITQGDTVEWSQALEQYNPATDTLKCFIRGTSALDLEGVGNGNEWDFTITSAQTDTLTPGKYKTQFVIFEFGTKKKALGITDLLVCPNFESLTELETRSADEIELEKVNDTIANYSHGKKSYKIGDREMVYRDLEELYKRQAYLRRRIAIASGKLKPGGRNIGVRFNG